MGVGECGVSGGVVLGKGGREEFSKSVFESINFGCC